MHDPHRRLPDALDNLDAAFAPFAELPFPVSGCTYCYGESDLEAVAGPVERVPEELISGVAHEAPGHGDDFPGLYRRLTPRIVRSLTAGRLTGDMVAARLLAAGWRNWPVPERSAPEEVWRAWWVSVLHTHPGTRHVTDVLDVLGATTGTLAPWLALWSQTRTEAADLHLADALDSWLLGGRLADLRLGFDDELHVTPELLPWLLSLDEGRIGAAQLMEVERIAHS